MYQVSKSVWQNPLYSLGARLGTLARYIRDPNFRRNGLILGDS